MTDPGEVDEQLVRSLIATQFREWSELPVRSVESGGTDNSIFRLGDSLSVRMPKVEWSVQQVDKEQRWLPHLSPYLSLPIPRPVAVGEPGHGYPWRWSVYEWLEGSTPTVEQAQDSVALARSIGAFVRELRRVPAEGGPLPGEHNFDRGAPLAQLDAEAQEAITDLESIGGLVDIDEIRRTWDAALALPPWPHDPVWVHGDIQVGNILVKGEKLTAVIDFGGLGVGDPASDLQPGWSLFRGAARDAFFEEVAPDEDTWERGRAWAFAVALFQLPYYHTRRPEIAARATHVLGEVLGHPVRGSAALRD